MEKDGVCEAGDPDIRELLEGDNQSESKWAYIIDADSESEFLSRLKDRDPRALVVSYSNIRKYLDWRYAPTREGFHVPEDFSFDLQAYPVLTDWVDDNMRGGVQGR